MAIGLSKIRDLLEPLQNTMLKIKVLYQFLVCLWNRGFLNGAKSNVNLEKPLFKYSKVSIIRPGWSRQGLGLGFQNLKKKNILLVV